MPRQVPTYLASGASSRAHHAFIVKLQSAVEDGEYGGGRRIGGISGSSVTSWERDKEVVRVEIERCGEVLRGRPSMKQIAETLIILLHCSFASSNSGHTSTRNKLNARHKREIKDRVTHRESSGGTKQPDMSEEDLGSSSSTRRQSRGQGRGRHPRGNVDSDGGSRDADGDGEGDVDNDVGLIAALQLAGGGTLIRERRIGYMYLIERLPRAHELGLLFINTIRKDLTSSNPRHILLALHAITSLPSVDLAPAVSPILESKALLRHCESAIRQRTLQALSALHLDAQSHKSSPAFPLSMGKLAKLLDGEDDLGVLRVIVRLIRSLIQSGQGVKSDERAYLVDRLVACVPCDSADPSWAFSCPTLILDVVRCLGVVIGIEPAEEADLWLAGLLDVDGGSVSQRGALLFEICNIVGICPQLLQTSQRAVHHVISLLDSSSLSPGVDIRPSVLPPNQHILVLRCLERLPLGCWDGKLSESEMGTIMQGLESGDDSVRIATLRLLRAMAPELLQHTLNNLLESLQSATDLALPLGVQRDIGHEQRVRLGLYETAARALEVMRVEFMGTGDVADEYEGGGEGEGSRGDETEEMIRGIIVLMDHLRTGQCVSGLADEVGEKQMWEEGCGSLVDIVDELSPSARSEAIRALAHDESSWNCNRYFILASLVCSCEVQTEGSVDIVLALLSALTARCADASLREVVVVASAAVLSEVDQISAQEEEGVLRLLQVDRSEVGAVVEKRARQLAEIIRAGYLGTIVQELSVHNLEGYSTALQTVHRHLVKQRKAARELDVIESPRQTSAHKDLSASRLRYEAYEPPSRSTRGAGSGVGKSENQGNWKGKGKSDGALVESTQGGEGQRGRTSRGRVREERSLLFDSEQVEDEERERDLSLSGMTIGSSRRISDPFEND